MGLTNRAFLVAVCFLLALCAARPPAFASAPSSADADAASPAATRDHSDELGEIVVTANKREQSANNVGMSITTMRGDDLIDRGVTSTADLANIVPGLTYQPSPFNTPVYTLRGVGFYDSTLSAAPTVAVYTDEVPLPFSAMTREAGLDLERVEVLKGPQGTLFGENTTGGAINYIAAKPTDHFESGLDASYGRFSETSLSGFVSGPLSSTVNARLSGDLEGGTGWQHSISNNSTLGAISRQTGRLLVDWTPSDALKVAINVNGWVDNSDPQAPQRIATYLSLPNSPQAPAIVAFPYPTQNAQEADWPTDIPMTRHDTFFQNSVRVDYTLPSEIVLTSITAYEHYSTNAWDSSDGTTLNISDQHTTGYINTITQELRASGKTGSLNWLAGGNFESDGTLDREDYYFTDATTAQVGPAHLIQTGNFSEQNIKSAAVFGNGEYKILDNLSFQAGARYTATWRDFQGCTYDVPGYGTVAAFEVLEHVFRNPALPFIPIPPGGCATFNSSYAPIITPLTERLTEQNVSWRTGLNYTLPNDGLLYVSVAKGYKAGVFPTAAASTVTEYAPVKQESLLAYEGGFKIPLADHRVQVNGAVFYYDYTNKQLESRIIDPAFHQEFALVNIPRSHVEGAEAEIDARPFKGLKLSVAATYLQTRIDDFVGYNNAGAYGNYSGSAFPYSPRLQLVSSAQYDFPLNGQLGGFLAADYKYNSQTNGSIGDVPVLNIKAYGLLDVRAGIRTADNRWTFEFWGRNVTNTYYWTNALQARDVYVRYTGMPETYGISLRYRSH
jgi:outer membrane receptor protein involved in Fe transport